MNLKGLHLKINILIEQANDMQKLLNLREIGFNDINIFLNFKQRRRFIACAYAKNSTEALERLVKVEFC